MVLEFSLVALLFKVLTFSFVQSKVRRENVEHYTNLWAVQLSTNDEGVLQQLRQCEGFEIVHQVLEFLIILFYYCTSDCSVFTSRELYLIYPAKNRGFPNISN